MSRRLAGILVLFAAQACLSSPSRAEVMIKHCDIEITPSTETIISNINGWIAYLEAKENYRTLSNLKSSGQDVIVPREDSCRFETKP